MRRSAGRAEARGPSRPPYVQEARAGRGGRHAPGHAPAGDRVRRGARPSPPSPSAAELVEDMVSSFPSVTPVCCSEMLTGVGPGKHGVMGMNWFHRLERRYIEYGSSFEATRTFGLFRAMYDLVYNMNLDHLSWETRDGLRAARRRGGADRGHPVPDLPRPPPPQARPRGPREARRGGRQLPPRGLGPRRVLLRRPLRQPADRLRPQLHAGPAPATSTRPASARSWSARAPTTSCSSAFPTTTSTPTASAPARPSTRSPRPTPASRGSSRRAAASTPSSTTTP